MSAPDNRLYEFGPFLLDASGRILLKDGATVRLTPKAFETLLVLVQNSVQVVEKERLLKEVWPDSFVEEGSLSRNIHELRKALGDDSSEPRYIETIPKRGYRFVAPVKISRVDAGEIGLTGVEGESTVIEKHTFARVISEEFEGTDLPAQAAPLSPVAGVEPLALPGVTGQRKRQAMRVAAAVAALLLAGAIGLFVYMKRPRISPTPTSRAKSTLVRLTNNNAMDGAPVWSPDGSRIAFWSNRDGKNEIYVMDADGSNVKRLTNNLADDDGPKWSPDGHKILFDSERDGNKEIYVMDDDGSNQTRLTRNNAPDSAGSWSPDGSKIAFSSNRAGRQHIYIMNADGSSLTQITDSAAEDIEPAWSPDGKRIAFTSLRDGNKEIYLMNADGSNQARLTADPGADDFPKWSPDGRILFTSSREGGGDIYIMDNDGANVTRLTKTRAGQPAWSPDGRNIAFVARGLEKIGGHFWLQIFVMDADGGNIRMLTRSPNSTFVPYWSPDGATIALVIEILPRANIFQVDSDGKNLRRLTAGPKFDGRPAFSPEGSKLAFQSNRDGNYEIYVMNLR